MSETQNIEVAKTESPKPLPAAPMPPEPSEPKRLSLALIVALGALAVSGWQVYSTQQQLGVLRQQLAKRPPDTALKNLREQLRATDARLAITQVKLSDASGQFATINNMASNFFTVSGVAATRVSPAVYSAGIAICIVFLSSINGINGQMACTRAVLDADRAHESNLCSHNAQSICNYAALAQTPNHLSGIN